MKADPSAQVRLLDLQELDARADQLRHQRALAARARRARRARRRAGAELDDQARDARIAVDDLTVEQTKVDADVEQVKTRRERDQQRIDQGLISNPKDLQRMQQEMVSLERRITSLEDDEIEVMERLEEAQRTLDSLTAAARRHRRADRRRSTATRDAQAGRDRPDARRARRRSAARSRPTSRPTCSPSTTGSARARAAWARPLLRARRCSGCSLDLDHAELATIRAAADDEVIRCEECSRILVRTSESGCEHAREREPVTGASSSRPTAARAATPARRRTARWSRTPTPARCSPRTAPRSGWPATTSRSTAA